LLCGFRQRRLGRFAGAVAEIVAGSEHVLRVHRALFPDARGSVIRLPLVPLAEAPPPPREPPEAIGFIGGLASIKGVGALLDAAPGLAAMGITLRVAGDGPLRPEIEAAAGRGSLVYDGFVDGAEKAAFVAGCDVGIVPSQWDEPSGPPYVVCEWLAASRPVLASARGGLGEVAAKVGAVVAIEPSPEGIVTGAKRLLQPEAWREAVAAIPAAEPRDLARWLDEHEAIYAAAARRSRAGAVA
jgi:glycosyltransferase involved in cell wall biosynthesis